MNGLAEISATYIFWRECVKRLQMCPTSKECQHMAMRAQSQLVQIQAIYFAEVRP